MVDITIFDARGQVVYATRQQQQFELPELASGSYFVRFMQDGQLVNTQRVIIP